jgi:hypothetical protein
VKRYGGEREESKEDRKSLSVHDCSDEDDGCLTGKSVNEMDEMEIFVFEGDEKVVL